MDVKPSYNEYAMQLTLDDARYHWLDSDAIPAAYADVDVKLDDNGQTFDTIMVSGLVGTRVYDSNDSRLSGSGLRDGVKPEPGWWIFIKRDSSLPGRAQEEDQKEMAEIMKRWDRDYPQRNASGSKEATV